MMGPFAIYLWVAYALVLGVLLIAHVWVRCMLRSKRTCKVKP